MAEFDKIAKRSECWRYIIVVRHIVTMVKPGTRIERKQPKAIHPELGDMVELRCQSLEIADTIAVTIFVGGHVQAVDCCVLVPKVKQRPIFLPELLPQDNHAYVRFIAVATRYDRLAAYLAFVQRASIQPWSVARHEPTPQSTIRQRSCQNRRSDTFYRFGAPVHRDPQFGLFESQSEQ
jgi:hypothetical protein